MNGLGTDGMKRQMWIWTKAGRAALGGGMLAIACLSALPAQADKSSAMPVEDLNVYGNYLSGLHAERLSNFPQSAAFLDAALAERPDNIMLRVRAFQANLGAGDMDRALTLAKEIYDSKTGVPPLVVTYLALDAIKREDWDGALGYLKEAQDGHNDVLIQLSKIWAEAGAGKQDAALKAIEPLRKSFAGIAALMEGMVRQHFGDLKGAETAYMSQVEDPLKAPGLLVRALIRVRLAEGRKDEARELLSQYLVRVPNQVEMEADMAQLMKKQALPPLAATPADAIAEGVYQIAIPYSRSLWENGMIFLRLSTWLNPSLDKANILMGGLLEDRQLFDQAIAAYGNVGEGSPYAWQSKVLIASDLYDLKKPKEAISTLEKLSLERPDQIGALRSLGQIYHSEQRYPEMSETYDRLIKRLKDDRPEYWLYYYLRGMAEERQKNWDPAEKDFLKALELQPDQPEVLNYLGYSWVDMGRNLDRAQAMLKKAVEQRYTGYVVDSLGWAYYRLGKYDDAVRELERAVSLEPTEPVINDHLGDAYWKVGRKREARYQWERASIFESDEIDGDELRKKIENGLTD